MRAVVFEPIAFKEFREWVKTDKKIFLKILELINNISQTPFEGIGKPELLKHQLSGYWSRRIDQKNRLVYKINEWNQIVIASCKNHY